MKKLLLLCLILSPAAVSAHCDSLDGPVVTAARAALESGEISPLLAWVQEDDEPAIREAFAKTLEVRKLGPKAAALADTWFFETVVRVHRAGEGAPYTGLKPAGFAEPVIRKLDAAVEKGDISELASMISSHAGNSITDKFEALMPLKREAGKSVKQGREYVAAYVEFMHYVEGVKNAVHGAAHQGEAGAKKEHSH